MIATKTCPDCGGHFPRHRDFMRVNQASLNGFPQYGRCILCDRARMSRRRSRETADRQDLRRREEIPLGPGWPGCEPYRPPSCHDVIEAAPFGRFLRQKFPGWTATEIAGVVHHIVSERRLRDIMLGRQENVEVSTVDNFFTGGLGRPDLINQLYPLEAADG